MELKSHLEMELSTCSVTDHASEDRHELSLDLSKFSSQTPIHEGMVFKIGGKGRLSRIQKRFFILYEGVIIYYHHHTTYVKDKKHGYRNGKVIRLDRMHLSKPESRPTRMKFCAVLHVPHESNKRKELLIAFHHRRDKNMWVELLQTQNSELKPSLGEQLGSKKKLPLYIQKMREIEYFDPKSRYHLSRFHSLPNQRGSASSSDFQSLRRLLSYSHSFSSLPADRRSLQRSLVQRRSQKHHFFRVSYSGDSGMISEIEEISGNGYVDCEGVSSDDDSSSHNSGLHMHVN